MDVKIRKALLVHRGALGDFILALRVVELLRLQGAEFVALLGRPAVASVALEGGTINSILDAGAPGLHELYTDGGNLPEPIVAKLRGYDLTVNMAAPGEARNRVARGLEEATGGRVISIDPRLRADWRGHITDQWLADLKMEGLEGEVGPPNLKLPDRRMWELLEDCGHVQIAREKPAIIHPGSGRSGKCWPLPNFLFLAERCAQFGPAAPHFLIGEVEESTWSRDKILQLESASTFTRNPSLLSAAALIASASLFIGNDSGMSHLAAALGTPTIAIFGPTDPAIWKPLGRDVAVFGGGGFPPATEVFEYIQERFISSWR